MKASGDRAARKLKERNFKLNTLLEVSNAINNLEYDDELYNHFRDILTAKLSLGKGVLLSDYNGWSVNLEFGTKGLKENNLQEKCMEFNRITVLNDHVDPVLSEFDVIIPIIHKSKPLSFLLLGDFDGEKIEVSPIIRHLPFIQTLTNLIVVAQENRRLFEESVEKAAMQKELELASRMQNMLIPDQIPERKDLDIHALYQPHQVVGGDYYDFFQISHDQTVFCIADVSGKGLSAAMLMSNFQAMLHAILESGKNLEELIAWLNDRISANAMGEKFITTFIAIYDHGKKELKYVNSGHQPALLSKEKGVLELKEGSSVLGIFDELPHLNVGKQKIDPDDVLIFFTDGICEVENNDEEEYGTDPLKKIMSEYRGKESQILVNAIMNDLNLFKGKMSYPDDLALLSVRFTH